MNAPGFFEQFEAESVLIKAGDAGGVANRHQHGEGALFLHSCTRTHTISARSQFE